MSDELIVTESTTGVIEVQTPVQINTVEVAGATGPQGIQGVGDEFLIAGNTGSFTYNLDNTLTFTSVFDSLSFDLSTQDTIKLVLADVLQDLDTLGPSTADGEFLVATGAGTLAWESGVTARTSIGLGTGDSPTFTAVTLSSGTGLTVGSSIPFSDSSGTLTLQNVDAIDATTGQTIVDAAIIDNASFEVLTATDLQTLWEENDAALLDARSTGVRYGGALTDLGSGVVRISAGIGGILDNTTPSAPTYTPVTWAQQDIDLSATDDLYFLYIDNTGTLQSSTTAPSHDDYRLNLWLHRVNILGNVYSASSPIVMPVQQYGPGIWDIWRAIGYIKSGLVLGPVTTNLTWAYSAGEVYQAGANFYVDPLVPHEVTIAAQSPVTFRHILQDGTSGSDVTSLDVGNYDVGGVLTAIPGASTRATIFTVKFFPANGNVRVFYGQEYFTTVAAAEQALKDGQHNPVIPDRFNDAVTLGWIIAQSGATDLSDGVQTFVSSNKFGDTGGAISSVGVGALLAVNNLSDVADAATSRQNLGLEIGVDIQAYDAQLADLAGITFADGDLIYFDGANLVALNDGTSGQYLSTDGAGNLAWATVAGSGDVSSGSSFTTDNAIIRADTVSGTKNVQQSGITIDDSNNVSGAVNISQTGYHDIVEITEPSSPSANTARMYAVDDGGGTTNLYWKDSNGYNHPIGKRVGEIIMWSQNAAPSYALHCDGTAVSRTTYAELFAIIGTDYGTGDGSTTFNLPDMEGEFVRGYDAAAGVDPNAGTRTANAPGGLTGDNVGTKQSWATEEITSAVINMATDRRPVGSAGGGFSTFGTSENLLATGTGAAAATDLSLSLNSAGLSTSTETRPTNVSVNFCIIFE